MRTSTPPKLPGTRSAAIAAAFAAIRQLSSWSRVWNSNFRLRTGEDKGSGYSVGDCPPEGSGLNIQKNSGSGESKLTAGIIGVYLAPDIFRLLFFLVYLFRPL